MGDASTGSLSSYAYILMLIHYLQKTSPPVVPVLQQLFQDGVTSCTEPTIDSWNCYFYEFSDAQKELVRLLAHWWLSIFAP
jgi:terminal uridylyltransferase